MALAPKRGPGQTRTAEAQSYSLDWPLAIGAGFVATAMGLSGTRNESLEIAGMLGMLAAPPGGPAALLVGNLWHLANGIVFALLYARVLLSLGKQGMVGSGCVLGAILWLFAMLIIPALLARRPEIRAGLAGDPGFFLLGMGMGWTPALFALRDHLVYGVLVGIIYKHDHVRKKLATP